MAKQIKARRAAGASKIEIGPRELMLAGLGAVSLTRKQSIRLYGVLVSEGEQLRSRIGGSVGNLSVSVNDSFYAARERVETAVTPVVERAEAAFDLVKNEVETRLAPVLARFGVKPAAAKRQRTTAKRTTAKRAGTKRAATKARKSA